MVKENQHHPEWGLRKDLVRLGLQQVMSALACHSVPNSFVVELPFATPRLEPSGHTPDPNETPINPSSVYWRSKQATRFPLYV